MLISQLPVELLAKILDGDHSFGAILLWKCGSRALMARLANGGIKHVELVDNNPFVAASWPHCLKYFKLQSLSITQGHGFDSSLDVRKELKQQYSGLEKLVLRFPGASEAVFSTFSVPTTGHLHWDSDDEDEAVDSKICSYRIFEAFDGEKKSDLAARLGMKLKKKNVFLEHSGVRIALFCLISAIFKFNSLISNIFIDNCSDKTIV